MDISDLITKERIVEAHSTGSKKQLLDDLSGIAASHTGIANRNIFDTLIERERLGSTGVGNGIAIPHGKLEGLEEMTAFLIRLETPVDFESLDNMPVDLVFCLLAPDDAGADHLKALARIARLVRDPDTVRKIRLAKDVDGIFGILFGMQVSNAA